MSTLSLFPPRVKIVDGNGLMTPEFYRAMTAVFQRVGGAGGDAGGDVFAPYIPTATSEQAVQQPAADAMVSEMVSQPLHTEAFPVGFVMITTVGDNPATYLGYGTWVATSQGMVPVGYLAGDPDFGTPGGTSGAKTKPISAHAGTAVAAHANHTHTFTSSANAATPHLVTQDLVGGVAPGGTTDGVSATLIHTVTQPDNHTDLNVIQPSMTFYVFQRTA